MGIFSKFFKKKEERNISQNKVNEPIGYFDCPINNPAVCSDDSCPCGPMTIPYGGGYLYISQSAVDFRKDARTDAELKVKGAAYIKSLQQDGKTAVVLDPTIYKAILICEKAAKRRKLDLQIAAADAKYAWETAQAPLRPTPINNVQESVNDSYETDNNLIKDIHFFIEIPGIDNNTNPNDITINLPKAFIDFADKELKLDGKLNLFVDENIDTIKLTKLKKLENFENVKNNFYSKYAESTNWETYYRSTEAGYRFSVLVEYNFAKSSWVQDFIAKTLADPTFQQNPDYQKKTSKDNSK